MCVCLRLLWTWNADRSRRPEGVSWWLDDSIPCLIQHEAAAKQHLAGVWGWSFSRDVLKYHHLSQQISVKHHFLKEPMHSTWFVDVWWLARWGHIQESVSAYRGEDGEEWCFKIADMVWARYPHGNSRDSNFMFFPMPSSPFWDVKRAPFLLGNRVRVCMESRWVGCVCGRSMMSAGV